MECSRGIMVSSVLYLLISCIYSQVISALHRRFSKTFTPALILLLSSALNAPSRASLSTLTPEQREREDSARISRQRPTLRVCSELALVGIIKDAPNRSGGEWIMKILKELVCLALILSYFRLHLIPFISYRMTLHYPHFHSYPRSSNHTLFLTSVSPRLRRSKCRLLPNSRYYQMAHSIMLLVQGNFLR